MLLGFAKILIGSYILLVQTLLAHLHGPVLTGPSNGTGHLSPGMQVNLPLVPETYNAAYDYEEVMAQHIMETEDFAMAPGLPSLPVTLTDDLNNFKVEAVTLCDYALLELACKNS